MADRTVYGLTHSENGWPMVDQGSCVWVQIPGTDGRVSLQIREGQPAKILGAFVADWNAYIEPVRDADSACWTPTNSVASSNHLSGTACDVCWNSHPFRVADAGFNPAQLATMNQMLDFYEDLVFWGNRWTNPKDAMHVQMNGDTYGAENVDKVNDFIDRKIRVDGFSTFRRGGTPALSRADGYAVRIIAEGRRRGITPRGIQIALATALVESNITVYANAKVPASMALPHDAVGSDGFSVGIFQQQVRDTGNGWWWGDAATCMGVESSAGLFFDRLAKRDYNNGDPGAHAQAVQQSAFPTRYAERFGEAVALYDRLSATAPPAQEDELSAEAERLIREMHRELTQRLPSRSPFRHLGEGVIDTWAGIDLNDDAHGHVTRVIEQAKLGHPGSLALLREVAAADPVKYPNRQDDALLARAVLADITPRSVGSDDTTQLDALYAENARLREENARLATNSVATLDTAYAATPSGGTTGAAIGRLYDAIEELRLADALPIESRAPLAALISVLQTKNGSDL